MLNFMYTMGHETTRNRSTTGEASPAGHTVVKSGQKSAGSGSRFEFIREFCFSLVSDLSEKGLGRTATQTDARSTTKTCQSTETAVDKSSFKGFADRRLSIRSLDVKTGGRNNRTKLWHSISSLSCLENSGGFGLELSETGATRFAEKRRRNRALEALSVAAYKKTLNALARIWFLSTNLVFCLSLMLPAPGRQKAKRLFSIISTNKIEFPPSAPSRFLPKENDWRFIFAFAGEISTVWTREVFWQVSSNILTVISFCCGIADQSTAMVKLSNSWLKIRDCIWNISPLTRRSLIRLNMFGINPIVPFQILRQRMWPNSATISGNQLAGFAAHKISFGHAFMLPSCPGHAEYFLYLCKAQ